MWTIVARKMLMTFWKPQFQAQLAKPSNSLIGRVVKHFLRRRNAVLEESAVKLCQIEPDHNALELGFGGGVGLRSAYWAVKDGEGRIYGLDCSSYMVNEAKKFCALEIAEGKVEVIKGDVCRMPFPNDFFDRVFHCNVYYFWPSLSLATKEIYRVMKPGGLMVTTLLIDALKELEEAKVLHPARTDPLTYMSALEAVGFANVGIKYYPYQDKLVYQAIFATKPKEAENIEPLDADKQEELLKALEKEVNSWETRRSVIRFQRPPPVDNEKTKN